jgi:putative transposase
VLRRGNSCTDFGAKSGHHFVEATRTFGWFNRYRRLSKDYEHNPESSEAWIYIAMIHRMSRFDLPEKNREDDLLQRPPQRMKT